MKAFLCEISFFYCIENYYANHDNFANIFFSTNNFYLPFNLNSIQILNLNKKYIPTQKRHFNIIILNILLIQVNKNRSEEKSIYARTQLVK